MLILLCCLFCYLVVSVLILLVFGLFYFYLCLCFLFWWCDRVLGWEVGGVPHCHIPIYPSHHTITFIYKSHCHIHTLPPWQPATVVRCYISSEIGCHTDTQMVSLRQFISPVWATPVLFVGISQVSVYINIYSATLTRCYCVNLLLWVTVWHSSLILCGGERTNKLIGW